MRKKNSNIEDENISLEENSTQTNAEENKENFAETVARGEEIERQSYSKQSQKYIHKMRVRGAEYGIQVPYLKQPLTGERTSTKSFKVMIIISSIIIAAAVGVLIWALAKVLIPFIGTTSEATDTMDGVNKIPILGLITSSLSLLLWLVAIGIPLCAALLAIACIAYIVNLIQISYCRAEEKAYGHKLGNTKTMALILGISLVVIGIALFVFVKQIWLLLVPVVASVYAFVLFAILQKERNTAKAWCETLPQEEQQNFKEYFKSIKKVEAHRGMDKQLRKSRGRVRNNTGGIWGLISALLYLLEGFADSGIVYHNMKNSPYRKDSTGLGWRGLRQLATLVLSNVIIFGLFYIISGSFKFGENLNFFSVMIMIIGIISIIYATALQLPMILNNAIKQIKLNKKPIGWITLVLALAVMGAIFAFIAFVARS